MNNILLYNGIDKDNIITLYMEYNEEHSTNPLHEQTPLCGGCLDKDNTVSNTVTPCMEYPFRYSNNMNYLSSEIVKIQKWFRGSILRLKQLPLIMYKIKKHLRLQLFIFSTQNEDGRINSCIDEDEVIKLLVENFGEKIKKPKIRMWYDILAFDYMYGWIPINIKTTTTLSSDNTGNLAMCVYAYTNEILDIHRDKSYANGNMSDILFNKLQNKLIFL